MSDRFGSWNTIDGASAPASSLSGRRSDAGSASPTQLAGDAPAGIGAPNINSSGATSPAFSSPSINPLLAATAAYPPAGGFSYASSLQGIADFIGKYMLPSPSPAMADDRPPFANLQSGLGTIGADVAPPVPLLTPRPQDPLGSGMSGWGASVGLPPASQNQPSPGSFQSGTGTIGAGITPPVPALSPVEQNPLGSGMSGWGASVTGPNAASTAVPPNAANGGSNVPWRPASVFPTVAPPVSYPPPTLPMKTGSYGYMLALAAGLDPEHPDEPPPGGIPGRILEWMRNNPDGVADG